MYHTSRHARVCWQLSEVQCDDLNFPITCLQAGGLPPRQQAGGARRAGVSQAQALLDIVFVSAEVAPWSKTGGLGDVVGSLPVALAARGHRVMVVAPRHACALSGALVLFKIIHEARRAARAMGWLDARDGPASRAVVTPAQRPRPDKQRQLFKCWRASAVGEVPRDGQHRPSLLVQRLNSGGWLHLTGAQYRDSLRLVTK